MCLDKDILYKGNKIYSHDTCVFVPQSINLLFTKSDRVRGDLPIGVTYRKRSRKFEVKCCDGTKKRIFLGSYNTPEEGFQAYKKYKEKLIKQIANKYIDQIPNKLYNALITYTVEIDD